MAHVSRSRMVTRWFSEIRPGIRWSRYRSLDRASRREGSYQIVLVTELGDWRALNPKNRRSRGQQPSRDREGAAKRPLANARGSEAARDLPDELRSVARGGKRPVLDRHGVSLSTGEPDAEQPQRGAPVVLVDVNLLGRGETALVAGAVLPDDVGVGPPSPRVRSASGEERLRGGSEPRRLRSGQCAGGTAP